MASSIELIGQIEVVEDIAPGYDYLFIDETQRITDIGINLKILHDNLPNLRILITGSSALEMLC